VFDDFVDDDALERSTFSATTIHHNIVLTNYIVVSLPLEVTLNPLKHSDNISYLLCVNISCFAFQSHVQNGWAMQHGKIKMPEALIVMQYARNYVTSLTSYRQSPAS